jgi:hypothetical protein
MILVSLDESFKPPVTVSLVRMRISWTLFFFLKTTSASRNSEVCEPHCGHSWYRDHAKGRLAEKSSSECRQGQQNRTISSPKHPNPLWGPCSLPFVPRALPLGLTGRCVTLITQSHLVPGLRTSGVTGFPLNLTYILWNFILSIPCTVNNQFATHNQQNAQPCSQIFIL